MTYKDVDTEKTIIKMPLNRFAWIIVAVVSVTSSIVGLFFTKLDKSEFIEFKKEQETKYSITYEKLNDLKVLSNTILERINNHIDNGNRK
jgi:hypothetical protein